MTSFHKGKISGSSAAGSGQDVQTAQAFAYNGQGMLTNNCLWASTTNAAVPENPCVYSILPKYYALRSL